MVQEPGSAGQQPQPPAATGQAAAGRAGDPPPTPPLAPFVANGASGPCLALGPADPAPNATIQAWLATVHLPYCQAAKRQAPAAPAVDPSSLAVGFWSTVPLPVPSPSVPPGYGITGLPSYLVTDGSLHPPTYLRATPLGQLAVQATGSYRVDWGDPASPGWQGPYDQEGQAWPDGTISHTYDRTGSYTITLQEDWTATWSLAGHSGTLQQLRTRAVVAAFRVEQVQAVITH